MRRSMPSKVHKDGEGREMSREINEASMAVAKAVKLCKPDVIPMYPITPQTHIVERLADFINDGELDAEMIHLESEHSVMSSAAGISAAGSRVFTASASQGLALMHEVLHMVSGMRLPVVMAVANRALSAPINIWNDHQDSMAARDTGWIQMYVESSQEAMDTIIQAFKLSENHDVLLPIMVCLDGFTLTHVYEPTDLPSQEQVDEFLPAFNPWVKLDPEKPVSMGPISYPNSFMDLKKQQQDAMHKALEMIPGLNQEFNDKFGRSYGNGLIELYKMEDAQTCVIGMGTICGTTRIVIDELREQGQKVGMIKIKTFRPFPTQEIKKALSNVQNVGVIDRCISFGNEGPVYTEVKQAAGDKKVKGFIAGLGGRDVTPEHIKDAIKKTQEFQEGTEWLM